MYAPSSVFLTPETTRLLLAACCIRGILGVGRETKLWNQVMVGGGEPVAKQLRIAVLPSLAITWNTVCWMAG